MQANPQIPPNDKVSLLWGYRCLRCGHEWLPMNKDVIPKMCAKCKSSYWDRPRKPNKEADK